MAPRELDRGEPAERDDVLGVASQDLFVRRDRLLAPVPVRQAVGADLHVVEVEPAGPAVIGLGGVAIVEPAQAPGRVRRRLAAPGRRSRWSRANCRQTARSPRV